MAKRRDDAYTRCEQCFLRYDPYVFAWCPRCMDLERQMQQLAKPAPIWTSQMLDALRDFFGGHEELQDAIYWWRWYRIDPSQRHRASEDAGLWMHKGRAVHEMYHEFIIGGDAS